MIQKYNEDSNTKEIPGIRQTFLNALHTGLLCLLFLVTVACLLAGCGSKKPPETNVKQAPSSIMNGCNKPAPFTPGTSVNEPLLSDGSMRYYRLHIPRDYNSYRAQPLVLNFHGHGSNTLIYEQLTGMSLLADRYNFIIAYPQGTVGRDLRTGWNTGPSNYPHINDVDFVSALITHLQNTLCVNPQRIYAAGFSNGGGMTNVLACQLSNRIAAFAIVSGGMHPVANGCHPERPIPLLEFHGTNDHTVPYNGNPLNDDEPNIPQWLAGWAMKNGCASTPKIFFHQNQILGEQWTSCLDASTVIHYRIYGGTHVWPRPGFTSATTEHGINASGLIWQFFQSHTLT
jgi:polyhydroxybutyrate depolymerase